jgi:hypothetical protein
VEPEQVLGGCGRALIALTLRKVNGPSVPFPAELSSLLFVPGYCRLIVLAAEVPENVMFTGFCCA